MNRTKQFVAEVIGDGKLFEEGQMEGEPERRPGPFAQDPSRTLPTKEQREKDYAPEKKETGNAAKRKPGDRVRGPNG